MRSHLLLDVFCFHLRCKFYVFYMLDEVVVFQSSFEGFAVPWILIVSQEGSTLSRSLEIISDSDCVVFKYVAHDCQESDLHLLVAIPPLDLMQPVKPDDQTIWVALHMFIVDGQHFPHFFKFSLRNSLHHVLPVFSVVK